MWNDLTMRERADLIRQGVALGYKDIDSIRNNYHTFGEGSTLNSSYQDPNPYYNRLDDKHKKEWRSLAAQRKKFNQMLQQYSPQIYNDPQLRNTMEFIAFNEGRWVRPTKVPEKSGATGYFQLTPPTIRTYNQAHNTNYSTKDPAQDFAMMQYTVQTSMDNINKLLKDPTFRRKAQELGWDQYDLLKASWLLGPTGMKNHVLDPKKYNPKDEYGSSASSYVKNNNSTGDDVMIVNRGVEQPPAILVTPEDVRRKLEEDKGAQEISGQQPVIEKPEPIVPLDEVVQSAQNQNQNQDSQSTEDYLNSVIESQQDYIQQLNEIQRRKAKYDFMLQATPVMQQIQEQEKKSSLDILKEHLYKQKEQQLFQQALQNRDTQQRWHVLGKYFNFSQPTTSYKDYINPLMEEEQSSPHKFDLAGTINTPYSNDNSTGQQITENQFAVPQYYPQYEWDPEQFYPTTRLGTNGAIYDNIDMTKPYEPIQSYPRVGEVNPVYKNPSVKGEPVEILHRIKDNDNQAVARYQDGELGIVNLPDNYWQRYLPEVVIPGRMQQLQGVIDKAQEGKGVYDLQQDLDDHLRYMDEKDRAQQDAFYNPRAVLDNASRIPLVGILPTISEYAYGVLKGGPEGQYWKDRAGEAASEQILPVGLVAANTNPVTAVMADSALLGSSLYDIDKNGLNEENGIGLALGMIGPSVRGIQIVKNNTLPYNLGNTDVTGGTYFEPTVQEVAESSPYKYQDPDVSMASIYKDYMKQQQLNEVRQYMQKGTVPDKYVLERGSKKFIEGKDGVWDETDFRELPKDWDRTVYDHLPKEVLEELENSTKPRMMAMRTDDPENVPYTDYKTRLFNQAWNDAVTNRKWVGVSDKVWQDYNKIGDNRTLAYITNDGKTIVANKDRHPILLNDDLGHEAEHGIDFEHRYLDILQRTKEEDAMLHAAYDETFDKVPTVEWTKLDPDYDMNPERKTLNRDARRRLLGSSGVRRLPWKRQNDRIMKATKEEVIDAVRKADGYGQAYIELLEKKYGEIPDDIVNAMRKAMMYVGVGTGIAVTVNKGNDSKSYLEQERPYKYGGTLKY